ncbi:MAG: hypothetical protein QGG53_11055 [Planctomycetota bacterium]|jgi:hypothetical protein|nr:hypothetical protein [Planctomycetota bacterium]
MKSKTTETYRAKGAGPFPDFESPGFRPIRPLVEDIQQKPMGSGIWLWLLVFVVGAGTALGILSTPASSFMKSAGTGREETAYEKRIRQSKIARRMAEELKGKITMPPPPPDPESVVQEAMTDSLQGDVSKLMGGEGEMLEEVVLQGIAQRVSRGLEAELKAVAVEIAEGQLTAEEINARQKALEDKAHELMNQELYRHRVKTQTKRAKMKSLEWYRKSVASVLLENIAVNVIRGKRNNPHFAAAFGIIFNGRYGWQRYLVWSRMNSATAFQSILAGLKRAAAEDWTEEGLQAWKEERQKRRRWIKNFQPYTGTLDDWILKRAFEGHSEIKRLHVGTIRPRGVYPTASWYSVMYGLLDEHNLDGNLYITHLNDGLLNEYLTEIQDHYVDLAEELDDRWEDLLLASARLKEAVEERQSQEALLKLLDERNAIAGEIDSKARAFLKGTEGRTLDFRKRAELSMLLRFQLLADPKKQDEMYERFIGGMVKGLTKLLKDFARSQFRKGILEKNTGVEEAVAAFEKAIIPVLEKDLQEKVCSRKRFGQIIFSAGSHRSFRDVLGDRTNVPERQEDIDGELQELSQILEKQPHLSAYVEARSKRLNELYQQAVDNVIDYTITNVLTGGWLTSSLAKFVEGVDYADPVKETLTARESAKQGRNQDLARLTRDGVPDTSAPMLALLLGGSKGHGANLQPMKTDMVPHWMATGYPELALQHGRFIGAPPAKEWGFAEAQVPVEEMEFNYKTPIVEGIPFLTRHPKFDGDLSEWVNLRPLFLKQGPRGVQPIQVYAGWNYQGYYFAYRVDIKEEDIYLPVQVRAGYAGIGYKKIMTVDWAYRGESFRVCFDALNARNTNRGEPHTQEFLILPLGTDVDPSVTGVERVISSQRDAKTKQFRGVKASAKEFLPQGRRPSADTPFRVSQKDESGYSVEIFFPRTLFNRKVLSPGWIIGFNSMVAYGPPGSNRGSTGSHWTRTAYETAANHPDAWGDLILLGTDPRLQVNLVDEKWTPARALLPGHSFLLTIVDPDRNVYSYEKDTVVVSIEVRGGNEDVEVFILDETDKNTGIFRGIINTQPGYGREVQGVMEVMPANELILSYVDFADAKGKMNAITRMVIPVVGGLLE